MVYNYICLCVERGNLTNIPLLFLGKTSLQDIHLLVDLLNDDVVKFPKYVPAEFSDLASVCAWASYSLFLNRVNLDQLAKDY